ncbi:MAG: biotin transporter BioY [Clostridiales bacterium]|jgi:biotin transport system substrate-specific component|nr:biotin transporter BioY [Clostridiales bacterium]
MSTARQITTKKLIMTGMFTSIISVMSQIIIPIQPIPFSLSFLAIFLTGFLLEPKYAFLSTLTYILLGAFGLPVFAGLKGGLHVLTGMTGGFIVAYPIMALITSISYQLSLRIKSTVFNKNIYRIVIQTFGMIISILICYLMGTLWFSYTSGATIAYSISVCVVPFIAFDLLKILLAVFFGSVLRKVTDKI